MSEPTITITTVYTANKLATTVKMPDGREITKSMVRTSSCSFRHDYKKEWDEEGLPEEVAHNAERTSITVCAVIRDQF